MKTSSVETVFGLGLRNARCLSYGVRSAISNIEPARRNARGAWTDMHDMIACIDRMFVYVSKGVVV